MKQSFIYRSWWEASILRKSCKIPNYEVNRTCSSFQKAQSGLFGPLGVNGNHIELFIQTHFGVVTLSKFIHQKSYECHIRGLFRGLKFHVVLSAIQHKNLVESLQTLETCSHILASHKPTHHLISPIGSLFEIGTL